MTDNLMPGGARATEADGRAVTRAPGPLRDPSALAELSFRERIWLHNGGDYAVDVDRVLWQMETFDPCPPPLADPRVQAEADRHTRAKIAGGLHA